MSVEPLERTAAEKREQQLQRLIDRLCETPQQWVPAIESDESLRNSFTSKYRSFIQKIVTNLGEERQRQLIVRYFPFECLADNASEILLSFLPKSDVLGRCMIVSKELQRKCGLFMNVKCNAVNVSECVPGAGTWSDQHTSRPSIESFFSCFHNINFTWVKPSPAAIREVFLFALGRSPSEQLKFLIREGSSTFDVDLALLSCEILLSENLNAESVDYLLKHCCNADNAALFERIACQLLEGIKWESVSDAYIDAVRVLLLRIHVIGLKSSDCGEAVANAVVAAQTFIFTCQQGSLSCDLEKHTCSCTYQRLRETSRRALKLLDAGIVCGQIIETKVRRKLFSYNNLPSDSLAFFIDVLRKSEVIVPVLNGHDAEKPIFMTLFEKWKTLTDAKLRYRSNYIKELLKIPEANISIKHGPSNRTAFHALRAMKATKFRNEVLRLVGMKD